MENDRILTLDEAARMLGRNKCTVRIYINSGALVAMRHPENRRISGVRLSAINRFIAYLEGN